MLPKTSDLSAPAPAATAEVKLSRRWQWATRGRAISYLMEQAVENPNAISLAAGLVDPSTLPVEETRRVVADLLGRLEAQSAVRQNGAGHTAPVEIEPAQIILTTGSQQLLSLVGEILL